jgi:hypothetical protein
MQAAYGYSKLIFLNTCDIKVWEHFQKQLDENQGFHEPREFPGKSLEYTAKLFANIKGQVIVECGTGIQGELSGNSVLYWVNKTDAHAIHCIDMDEGWINSVRMELGEEKRVAYHHEDCFKIVPTINEIDLIYMDFWVGDGKSREKAYLDLYNASNSPKMILIDDSDHCRPWKQTMIVPCAVVSHGYRLICIGRQTLLIRGDVARMYSQEIIKLRHILE